MIGHQIEVSFDKFVISVSSPIVLLAKAYISCYVEDFSKHLYFNFVVPLETRLRKTAVSTSSSMSEILQQQNTTPKTPSKKTEPEITFEQVRRLIQTSNKQAAARLCQEAVEKNPNHYMRVKHKKKDNKYSNIFFTVRKCWFELVRKSTNPFKKIDFC